jgi:cytoskeletal protein CcmA (bactofilin family)
LDVSGNGNISGTVIVSKLGINKSSPTCALDLVGDASISGNLTTNNLVVNGKISGAFTLNSITTGNITNTYNISTDSLSASGYCKIGNESTNINSGVFIAGRTKDYYPIPYNNDKVQTKRGVEIFWNTVPDTRNYFRNSNSNYDGLAGDTTFMNYAGGYGQGGYSFQTTAGTGDAITANPTVLFEMINGKDFTINGGLKVGSATTDEIIIKNNDNYVKLGFVDNVPVGYLPSSSTALKLYHSVLNAYSYMNAHPLVIKESSLTVINANNQLVFPMPEYIYVDLLTNDNDIDIVLPNLNINVGSVDPKTEIFRFKIRQTKTSNNRWWHLKTFNNSSSAGGTIYNYQNSSIGTYYYRPEAWLMEVHFYLGNWYCNTLN